MKRILQACLITAAVTTAFPLFGGSQFVNIKASKVNWLGAKKLTNSSHTGYVDVAYGKVNIKNDKVLTGEVILDMNSIENTDISDKKNKGKLVGHLKSPDFFGVKKFPYATIKIQSAKGDTAKGMLTIRDKTHPVAIKNLKIKKSGAGHLISGKTIFDRSKFDVKYNSETFFSAKKLGDQIIKNNIEIDFEILASKENKQQAKVVGVLIGDKKTWLAPQSALTVGVPTELLVENHMKADHGFEIPGLVKPLIVKAGSTSKVVFTPTKIGEASFKCHLHPAHVGGAFKIEGKSTGI